MAAKFPQDLEDHVTCPICLGQYQDPRVLPCLHTYCKGCLEALTDKGRRRYSIKCPECREVTQVMIKLTRDKKCILILKRVVAVHIFGSLLRNIHFSRRKHFFFFFFFSDKSYFLYF